MSDRNSSHTITNHIKFHPLSKLTITLQGSYQLINPARSKPNAMLANYATWNGNKHIRTCLPNHETKISYWHAVLTPATKNRSETQHFLHEHRPASNLSPQKNTTEKVHVWWRLGRAQWITRTITKCREFHIQARWALAKERRQRAPHTRFQALVQKHAKKICIFPTCANHCQYIVGEQSVPKRQNNAFCKLFIEFSGN